MRSPDGERESLKSKVLGLIDTIRDPKEKGNIQAYHRVLIDADFSIHIFHESNNVETNGSRLGLRIVSALKEFCLVNHTIWHGIDKEPEK